MSLTKAHPSPAIVGLRSHSGSTAFAPAIVWALAGAGFLVIQAIGYVGWFTSGDFQRTPTGPTPVPPSMERSVLIAQVVSVVAFVVFLVFFVLRPWRRARHVTLDVLLCLAFQFVFWQDDAMNIIQPQVVFNAALFNRGSWYAHLPGWISPNAELFAWPPLLYLAYTWGLFGGAMLGGWLMGRMKQRWPQASTLRVVATLFAGFLVLEFIMEPLILRVGLWSYPGTIGWMTLFEGQRYQFPVYEGLLMAGL